MKIDTKDLPIELVRKIQEVYYKQIETHYANGDKINEDIHKIQVKIYSLDKVIKNKQIKQS